jgi:hypothetical protein
MSTKPLGPTLSALALTAIVSAAVSPSFATDKTIKIGALLPMSGPESYFGAQDRQGIELALEALNQTGVNGFKFEVQYEDSACSPLPATQAAKRILDQYKPDIAIGEECSDATLAIMPVMAGKSTTLRAVSGVLRPRAGTIYFHGRDIRFEPGHTRKPWPFDQASRVPVVAFGTARVHIAEHGRT